MNTAIVNNDICLVSKLIHSDPSILHKTTPHGSYSINWLGFAIYYNRYEIAKYLMEKGLTWQYYGDGSYIHWVASKGNYKFYKLVSENINLNIFYHHKERTETMVSIGCGCGKVCEHKSFEATMIISPIIHSALTKNNDIRILKDIISRTNDLNAINNSGLTPLLVACENGLYDHTKLLLDCGADPNYLNTEEPKYKPHGSTIPLNGLYPLHATVLRNNTAIAKLLIDYGANITLNSSCYIWKMNPLSPCPTTMARSPKSSLQEIIDKKNVDLFMYVIDRGLENMITPLQLLTYKRDIKKIKEGAFTSDDILKAPILYSPLEYAIKIGDVDMFLHFFPLCEFVSLKKYIEFALDYPNFPILETLAEQNKEPIDLPEKIVKTNDIRILKLFFIKESNSFLRYAFRQCNYEMVKYCLENGNTTISVTSYDVLYVPEWNDYIKTLKLLTDYGYNYEPLWGDIENNLKYGSPKSYTYELVILFMLERKNFNIEFIDKFINKYINESHVISKCPLDDDHNKRIDMVKRYGKNILHLLSSLEECGICMENVADKKIDTCGHYICSICHDKVKNCPRCNCEI